MQLIFCNIEEATAQFAKHLSELLKDKKVLWLLSGGSNIPISINVMRSLSPDLIKNLSLMPVDERFGPSGHKDSNWFQLINSGFNPLNSKVFLPLIPDQTFDQAAELYNDLANQAYSEAEIVIAQIGMGPDGHIAGILPGSVAGNPTDKMVVHYEARPYQRLTLSLKALGMAHVVYCFIYGESKRQALSDLMDQDLPVSTQPVQFLKQLKEVYLYNDQLEGK